MWGQWQSILLQEKAMPNNCLFKKIYPKSNKLSFKVMFLINPQGIQTICVSHIQPAYLYNTSTSISQPLNQAILKTFKSYYTCHTFHSFLDASEETFVGVSKCW
jgi:hypothetical protein